MCRVTSEDRAEVLREAEMANQTFPQLLESVSLCARVSIFVCVCVRGESDL